MARTKRVPNRRESSSEFFNKQTATWEDSNGKQVAANGRATSAAASKAQSDPGVLQLVIAVVGIYASL